MIVSKSISFRLEDLVKIQERIENGEAQSISDFVRKAVKNELRKNKKQR
jgi:Arc/MetJ-type ribon-helix-helix transcriptional regulator